MIEHIVILNKTSIKLYILFRFTQSEETNEIFINLLVHQTKPETHDKKNLIWLEPVESVKVDTPRPANQVRVQDIDIETDGIVAHTADIATVVIEPDLSDISNN